MTENDNKQPHTVGRQLASGVFYTSIAKYAGIVVTLVVSGVLARLFTPEEFGVVNIATVVIAFFAIFSDLGIGPAVIQHKNLDKRDLGGIFSLTLWSGAVMALLFFAASGLIASFYDDSAELRNILRILSANLFFAAANIVPNGLILKEKRFRFAAVRSLSVQVVGGAAAICTGIFAFGTTQAVAWCICISFAINFIQCYHALFCLTLRTGWGAFWRSFLSPLLLSALVCLPLAAVEWLLPPMPMLVSLAAKGAAALAVWLLYIQFSGEYDLKGTALRLLSRKN